WRVLAQSDRATISGTVEDASGALVADAQVVVTNVNSNLQSSTAPNAAGRFALLNLAIGKYSIVCSKDGFEKYRHSDLDVAISQEIDLDIALTVGSKSETLPVVGEPRQLQTLTSSISTNLGNAAVTELPLNVQGGRNLATFMF